MTEQLTYGPFRAPAKLSVDWDAAVRTHHRRVVVSVMALGIPVDRAEDIANQAWLKIFKDEQAGKLERVLLPGLIIKQARFLALNAIHKEKEELKQRVLIYPGHPILRTTSTDLEQRLLSREQLSRCLEALERCSTRERAVFGLVYADPAPSHAEVAERVGLSVQRVRQILCELRKKLRQEIEEGA